MRLSVELDQETSLALQNRALSERRPMPEQAFVFIRQALGLTFPMVVEPTAAPGTSTKRGS